MSSETYKVCRTCKRPSSNPGRLCMWCGQPFRKRRPKVIFPLVALTALVIGAVFILLPRPSLEAHTEWPRMTASQRPACADILKDLSVEIYGHPGALQESALLLLGQPDRSVPGDWHKDGYAGTWEYQCRDGKLKMEIEKGRIKRIQRDEESVKIVPSLKTPYPTRSLPK
jgi:hypothetical protein